MPTAFELVFCNKFWMQNDMIKPAIQGVQNVLKACAKAGTVKRVVLTSSAAAVTINTLNGTGIVMDESHWTDVEFLSSAKPPTWVTPQISFCRFFSLRISTVRIS